MAARSDGAVSTRLERVIDRNAACKMVSAMLDGSGLTVRPLKYELVITNPAARDKGQVRVEYATGHVSRRRTVLDHWGLLQGFAADDDADERYVGLDKILQALTDPPARNRPGGS
jgi:hypothetical protein